MHLHHIGIRVADLDASITWYQRVLKFRLVRRFEIAEAALRIAELVAPDGSRLELLDAVPASTAGEIHVCFEVEDVDAAADQLRARGATLTQNPRDIAEAGVRNCWLTDDEGNLIELIRQL